MMIVDLPNGSKWDNDKEVADQEELAQFWLMETQKLALLLDPSVLRTNAAYKSKSISRETMCYSGLERGGLEITSSGYYTHRDWQEFLKTGVMIPDEDFYNLDLWIAHGIVFNINEK